MDPLSIGASIIAVVGATRKAIKGIRRLKALQDAPQELDDLLTEISQFELILQAIQRTCKDPESDLERLLEMARRVLVDFESLIEYKLTQAGTSTEFDRWQWTHSSKDVDRLRGQLRNVTANLVALIDVDTSTSLHQISHVTTQVLSDQQQLSNQVSSAIALLVQLLEESPSTQAALTGSLGKIRQLTIESTTQTSDIVVKDTKNKTLRAGNATSKLHSQNVVLVSRAQTISICDSSCACKCHVLRKFGNPGARSNFFGHGFIQTAGYAILGTQCDTESCIAHAAPRISIQYRLPKWLASRMILLWFTSSPACSPELLLRVPRVAEGHKAFRAVYRWDLESLKSDITNGDCTPYDVDEYGSDTYFAVAAAQMNWEMLFFFSNHRDFCNPASVTPWAESNVWKSLVLTPLNPIGRYPDRRYTSLTELFPLIEWGSYVESQTFSTLHQIVCGLSGLSLDVELQGSTATDKTDRDGRIALWYAVRHRRLDYVRTLLEQGADPNIGDPPLWAAVTWSADFNITKMLLDHGATLRPQFNPPTKEGWLPWPESGLDDDVLAIDKLFIRHGIELDHSTKRYELEDVTILMRLSRTYWGSVIPHRLEQMIQHGANIEIPDKEGKTAIMHAVGAIFPGAFDILARAGARLNLKTVTGRTILHIAIAQTFFGRESMPRLCEVIRDADLTQLDIEAKDDSGLSAFDLLRIRNGTKWDAYCQINLVHNRWWESSHNRERKERELGFELGAISALEKLLHHIQKCQGVPEADRYPPLGAYLSGDVETEAIPGAWPAYDY